MASLGILDRNPQLVSTRDQAKGVCSFMLQDTGKGFDMNLVVHACSHTVCRFMGYVVVG